MYEGHFEALWGHFGSILGSLVHPDGPNLDILRLNLDILRLNLDILRLISRKYTFFPRILLFKEAKRILRKRTAERPRPSGRG